MNQLRIKKKDPTIKLKKIEFTPSHRYESLSPNNRKQAEGRQSSHIQYKKQLLTIRNSHREPIDQNKFSRFGDRSLDISQRVHSLSLKKTKKLLHRSTQKHKKGDKKQTFIIPKTSFQKINAQNSPYMEKSKKLQGYKKLKIVPDPVQQRVSQKLKQAFLIQPTNQQASINRTNSIKKAKSRYRVNSTFARLDSVESKQHENNLNSSIVSKQTLEIARKLIKSGQNRQALLIIKDSLKKNPSNLQILELCAMSWYNLGDYQKSVDFSNQIIQYDPSFNSQIFVICSLSYAKMNIFSKALQTIYLAQQKFPENAQIYYYKGKILDYIKQYEKAAKAFKKSYELCHKGQTLVQLSECHQKLNQQQKQLQVYDKILQLHSKQVSLAYVLNKKISLLLRNNKFNQILESFSIVEKSLILNKELQESNEKCEIMFNVALAYYKLKIYSKAYIIFEDCSQNQSNYLIKSYKMMMIIKILQKNYYDASYLIQALQKYKNSSTLSQRQDSYLNMLCKFIDGSIHLIKRNYKEGIELLSSLQMKLHQNFSILKNQNVVQQIELIEDQQSYLIIRNNIHMYLSYGLFCIGQFDFSKTAIRKQRQICDDPFNFNQKSLTYNMNLCETFLSYQDRKFQKCLSMIKQAKSLCSMKMEVYFYQAIVLIQILLQKSNKLNFLNQKQLQNYKNKQSSIINSIKQNFVKALEYVSSSANNITASLLYHKCIFHIFLQQWKEALHAIDQGISKSDDNYWRYYYTRALVLALVHNFQDSLIQVQVAISSSNRQKAECFLLRSKCLQIQGHGNQAFRDLQEYISNFLIIIASFEAIR